MARTAHLFCAAIGCALLVASGVLTPAAPSPEDEKALVAAPAGVVTPVAYETETPHDAPVPPLRKPVPPLRKIERQAALPNQVRRTPPVTDVPPPRVPPVLVAPNLDDPPTVRPAANVDVNVLAQAPAPATPPAASPATPTPVTPSPVTLAPANTDAQRLPPVVTWWDAETAAPLRATDRPVAIDVPGLMSSALAHSEKVQAVRLLPEIRRQDIGRAHGEFDTRAFVDSKFLDRSDPVSDTLTTGGPRRINEHVWDYNMGVRRRLTSGGSLEAGQQFGHKNSNSLFFTPNDQGSSQMSVGLTQPLLRGRGQEYSTAFIVLASIETQAAQGQYEAELQNHLSEVTQAYWNLYLERASLLQRRRHLERAEKIAGELEARQKWDALRSQMLGAQAAVARRRAELARSDAAIRNGESRIRSLVNDPALGDRCGSEIVPAQAPVLADPQTQLCSEIERALQSRPEVTQALQHVRAAGVKLKVSENELLPQLNLVLQSYVRGIAGRSDVPRSFTEQFATGAPTYSAGLVLEVPLCNTAARSLQRQREYELTQVSHQLRATLANVTAEVEIAARNLDAAYQTAQSWQTSLAASRAEVEHLEARWRKSMTDERNGSAILENLLRAHERLLEDEQSSARALAAFHIAEIELQRATGRLVEIVPGDGCVATRDGAVVSPAPQRQ